MRGFANTSTHELTSVIWWELVNLPCATICVGDCKVNWSSRQLLWFINCPLGGTIQKFCELGLAFVTVSLRYYRIFAHNKYLYTLYFMGDFKGKFVSTNILCVGSLAPRETCNMQSGWRNFDWEHFQRICLLILVSSYFCSHFFSNGRKPWTNIEHNVPKSIKFPTDQNNVRGYLTCSKEEEKKSRNRS